MRAGIYCREATSPSRPCQALLNETAPSLFAVALLAGTAFALRRRKRLQRGPPTGAGAGMAGGKDLLESLTSDGDKDAISTGPPLVPSSAALSHLTGSTGAGADATGTASLPFSYITTMAAELGIAPARWVGGWVVAACLGVCLQLFRLLRATQGCNPLPPATPATPNQLQPATAGGRQATHLHRWQAGDACFEGSRI